MLFVAYSTIIPYFCIKITEYIPQTMLLSFIYILPSIVCLIWIVSFSFQVKSSRQKVYAWSLLTSLIYYMGFSTMAQPHTDYASLILMDGVLLPAGLAMFGMLNIYVNMMLRHRQWTLSYLLWLAPALCIGVAGLLMYGIIGMDTAKQVKLMYDHLGHLEAPYDQSLYILYIWVTQKLFNYSSILLGLCLILQCGLLMRREGYQLGDVSRFFFARHSSTPGRVIATLVIAEFLVLLPLATLPGAYEYLAMGLGQSLLLALIKHCQCHVVFFSDDSQEVTLHALSHLQNKRQVDTSLTNTPEPAASKNIPAEKNDMPHIQAKKSDTPHIQPVENDDSHSSADEAEVHHAPAKSEMMAEELRRLLDKEELWREDDLTINTLAERLHVSRSTLSNMINAYYGRPFRDLINERRIQSVKSYMLENPTATQDDIASACGFKTASYMNIKFKEATGTTPLLWLVQKNKP